MTNSKLLLISVLALLMSITACKSTQGVNSSNDPTGDVVVKQTTTYKIYPTDQEGTLLDKRFFNKQGQVTKFYAYDFYGSGEIEDSTAYFYNDLGQKVKEITYGNNTTTRFSYDKLGRLIENTWTRPNGQGETSKYTYNHSGDLTEIKYFNSKGQYDFSRVFELGYDRKGRVIEEKKVEKYTDGSPELVLYHMKYEYNSSDSLLTKERLREDGTVDNRTEYTYDNQGRLIQEVDISISDGVEVEREKTVYHVNDAGKTTKDESFSVFKGKETLNYTNSYKYDKYGHQTWMMYEHADGTDAWGERTVYQYF